MWRTRSLAESRKFPPPLHVDGFPEFEVREILNSKILRRKIWYFVDWVGYDILDRSWQLVENLANAQSAISDLYLRYPDRPTPPVVSS